MRLTSLNNIAPDLDVQGITADSRAVKRGYIFAALPGNKTNGADYIEDAISHGATAVLVASGTSVRPDAGVVVIEDENPRLRLAKLAAEFYGRQPNVIVAVTGTSGKTSTVTFTQQLWTLFGIEGAASLGTLGVRAPGISNYGSLTTPDTVSLQATLADLAAAQVTHLAMEASSHGIDQYRLDGVHLTTAAYTNLSRDHLDYHQNMDSYFQAKARLFSRVLPRNATAVLNADDEYFERLMGICSARGQKIISYGRHGDDIRILERTLEPMGQKLKLRVMGQEYNVLLPLVGEFQTMNALCALGLVLAGDGEPQTMVPLLEKLQGVPGRLELVPGHPKGAAIYVDYAHKPAAVEAVLNTLRPHTAGNLYCLLGCGGNRDAGKRPIMGRIAAGLSDFVVVTDDNPRNEDAAHIRSEVMAGAPDAKEIGDRREAIRWAVEQLQDGDVLVVAGKGHETGQIVGDVVEPFDDVAEVKKAIQTLTNKGAV